jgi:hypothetical protein
MMIVSLALIEIWEEAFNNADYLHQRYQSEGRPREIAIKAPTPGIRMHPTAHTITDSPPESYGQRLCKDDIFKNTQQVQGRSSQTLQRM